jgi:hypothetical protein
VINQAGGTIDANSTGQALLFQSYGLTNHNVIEATNGGILQFNGGTIVNGGANLTSSGAGSDLQLYGGATVQGGTLTATGGGTMETLSNQSVALDGSTLGAITLNGTYTGELNSNTYLLGTINNKNNIQLNAGTGYNVGLIVGSSNVNLQGGGTVTMTAGGVGGATGAGAAYLQQQNGGSTLTNVNNTIQGAGVIGYNGLNVLNTAGGTIDANSTGQALLFQSYGLTNNNVVEATNGGILQFNGGTVFNGGGSLTASGAGSDLQLYGGVNVRGGSLSSIGGGTVDTLASQSAALDGSTTQGAVTLNGLYTGELNSSTYLLGTIVNNGTLEVNAASGYNTNLIVYSPTVTLKGGGTVTLSSTGAGSAYLYQEFGGSTLANYDNTIQGSGIVGYNGLSVDNQAAGTILANVSGGTLNFQNGGSLTNEGRIQVNAGSTLSDSFSSTTNSGQVTIAGGGAAMTVTGIYNQTGGKTLINSGGTLSVGSVNETGGTIQVDGTLDPASFEIYGVLSGTGSVVGNVTNDGTVIAGDSVNAPGVLSETGNYVQNLDGTLDASIASKTLNSTLDVTGNISLNGLLNVDLLSGYTPVIGDVFDVLSYTGSETGAFSGIVGSDAGDWTVFYGTLNSGQIDLELTTAISTGGGGSAPDASSSLLLLGCGVLGLALAARLRRRAA